ncbi:serine/threonine-protein kinase HAL4/sat4, partial [Modicella reniformis]
MDHENIIRTIDLVRDQPGQELMENELAVEQQQQQQKQERMRFCGGRPGEEEERHSGGDYHDCSCPREHHSRVKITTENGEEQRVNAGSGQGDCVPVQSTPLFKIHRPIPRKSRPQRKRSTETFLQSMHNRPSSPRISNQLCQQGDHQKHLHHHHNHLDRAAAAAAAGSVSHQQSNLSKAQLAAATKKKQRLEQELRQKEVQRLKQQKQREKQHAKKWQPDQFPEYCMVMEYAAGGDLFNLLTKTYPPISLQEIHCLWRQLINGVQYMHNTGVAHRDLKPENLLLDATGRILKITDFGIANVFKSVGDPFPLPCRGVIGSEPYIPPEAFYQDEYDPRAVDVWACGIIFYVMFYSAMPWSRADQNKDTRFSHFVKDIMTHRQDEVQRQLQYHHRQQHHKASSSSLSVPIGFGSLRSEEFSRPHDMTKLQQFPPDKCGKPNNNNCSQHRHKDGIQSPRSQVCSDGESPNSSMQSSSVSRGKDTTTTTLTPTTTATVPTVYSTYAYNNYIGGHRFIDRMEPPGCRRVLYGILEPDARKRMTIDQVVNDEWVNHIRYCTDCVTKQEQQAMVVF